MSDDGQPADPDDADAWLAGETISPWLEQELPIGANVGPPATREVLNRWLDRVMADARKLLRKLEQEAPDLEIDSIELSGEYPDIEVVIFFRDARMPGCQFGYTWPIGSVAASGVVEDPASEIWANFDEVRWEDLPEECDPDDITWIPN